MAKNKKRYSEAREMLSFKTSEKKYETALAWGLEMDDRVIPFPKSKCKYDYTTGVVKVPRWLAKNEGLV